MSARAVLFDLDDTLFDHRGCSRDALASVQNSPSTRSARMALDDFENAHTRVARGTPCRRHARAGAARAGAPGTIPAADRDVRRHPAGRSRRAHGGHLSRPLQARCAAPSAAPRDLLQALSDRAHGSASSRTTCSTNNGTSSSTAGWRASSMHWSCPNASASRSRTRPFSSPRSTALQCDAAETVMVGDSWTADIAGARAAGIRPIWFNPLGAKAPDGEPVAELRSLEPAAVVAELILER